MSRSADPDHFFQTTHSVTETRRKALKSKNKNGNPIRLPSKVLALIADPQDAGAIYVAESGGTARRLVLDTGESSHLYRGPTNPTAPLTSLALSPSNDTLFAGSWDKSIWAWDSHSCARKRQYKGHTDFVKCVLCLSLKGIDILASGSADGSIIIWNVESGERLFVLKSLGRGILDLAVDPETLGYDGTNEENGEGEVILFSASSLGEIRRWSIKKDLSTAAEISPDKPITHHETSVYALYFDTDSDLWTASADNNIHCLSRHHSFTPSLTLQHSDYVRSVAIDDVGGNVISAGRDEDVKVWDKGSGELKGVFEGHWEEVMGLVVVGGGRRVVSGGIDGTVRVWGLDGESLERAKKEAEEGRNGVDAVEVVKGKGEGKENPFGIDEDEMRELEELMDDGE